MPLTISYCMPLTISYYLSQSSVRTWLLQFSVVGHRHPSLICISSAVSIFHVCFSGSALWDALLTLNLKSLSRFKNCWLQYVTTPPATKRWSHVWQTAATTQATIRPMLVQIMSAISHDLSKKGLRSMNPKNSLEIAVRMTAVTGRSYGLCVGVLPWSKTNTGNGASPSMLFM